MSEEKKGKRKECSIDRDRNSGARWHDGTSSTSGEETGHPMQLILPWLNRLGSIFSWSGKQGTRCVPGLTWVCVALCLNSGTVNAKLLSRIAKWNSPVCAFLFKISWQTFTQSPYYLNSKTCLLCNVHGLREMSYFPALMLLHIHSSASLGWYN